LIFIWIIGGVMVGVVILATIVKMMEVRKASTWLSTSGKITKSKVQARKTNRLDGQTVGNFAQVVYEFQVESKTYHGKRVSIGEEAPDFQVEETLAKYPVGAMVTVFYDPANPNQAVLERDVPPEVSKGILYAFIFFIGGTLIVLFWFTSFPQYLSHYLPNPENSTRVSFLGGIGIFVALLGVANYKRIAAAAQWPTVTAQIVKKDAVSSTKFFRGRLRRMYRARVVYEYEVNGRKYVNDRLGYGDTISVSKPSFVNDPLPDHREGSFVRVYYNPQNPSEAVFNPRSGFTYVLWILAAIFLAAAAYYSGFFNAAG
jgi:hypothetical protein